MEESQHESPPSRRDKPQSLSISPEQVALEDVGARVEEAICTSSTRSARQRVRDEPIREREHSCDELSSVNKQKEEFTQAPKPPRRESLNNCESQKQQQQAFAPAGSGLHKAEGRSTAWGNNSRPSSSVVVAGGLGNLSGPTTRKCVLTLDGYSYVIVASTPETLPTKREEATAGTGGGSTGSGGGIGAATSSAAAGGGAAGGVTNSATTEPKTGEQSPTVSELGASAAINGQVAKHGSLTIVRRSNSRKNFAQTDGQSQSNASPSSSGKSFFQTPVSETPSEQVAANRPSSNVTADSHTADTTVRTPKSLGTMQPSSPNETNFVTNADIQSVSDRATYDLRTDNENDKFHNSVTVGHTPLFTPLIDQMSHQSLMSGSNISVGGTWDTETLPTVDTPDALNKAALRIRSLLRRMDHETVAYEDMQRNLHYAARVLEAVFIDESRSPTSGKSKLGHIASSSVESEDSGIPNKGCNCNCKNLNNNDSKSSCKGSTETEDKVPTTTAPPDSLDNQPTAVSCNKDVLLLPETHREISRSPLSTETPTSVAGKELNTVEESVHEEQMNIKRDITTTTTLKTTTYTPATTAVSNESLGDNSAGQCVSSSSSCSNKATAQRQRRLRTPVWARSMSTNKTYYQMVYTA